MSLAERLIGIGITETIPKISVHQFMALLAERKRNRVTNQQVIDILGLDDQEQTELLAVWAKVNNNSLTATELHDVLLLAEAGMAYTTVAALRTRLGV